MDHHMGQIWGLLRENDPVIVSHRWRERLSSAHDSSIWKPDTPLERFPCAYCSDAHWIIPSPNHKRYFYTCDVTQTTHLISETVLQRWRLDLPRLLSKLAHRLGIEAQVMRLHKSAVWRLGVVFVGGDKEIVECWLCRQPIISTLSWLLRQDFHTPVALLTLSPTLPLEQLHRDVRQFDLNLLTQGQSSREQRYFQQWITRSFQRVLFEQENGDLWADGIRVVTIPPASSRFYLLQCLWERFNQPVSYEEIWSYCTQKMLERDGKDVWRSQELPHQFCHAIKREIKRIADTPKLIDQMIIATKTFKEENGYRLAPASRV